MHRIAIAIIATTGFAASADIAQVDEFSSFQFEGFNDLDMKNHEHKPVSIFDGMGEVLDTTKHGWLQASSRWSYHSGKDRGVIGAYEGSKMLGSKSGAIEYRFNTGQKSFGGYFASIDSKADASVKFYAGDDLVGTDVIRAADGGDWSWTGWSSDVEFDRVAFDSNHGKHGKHGKHDGFLMHDAVRVSSAVVPTQGSAVILAMGILVGARRRR